MDIKYTQPLVSIVITTKNAAQFIYRSLESISQQTYKKFEVIIVDNFSTDQTKNLIFLYKKKLNLDYLFFFQSGPERSRQRNFGLAKAKGQYFLYLDVDMILSPKLIESCIVQCENQHLDALYIPEIILGSSYWSQVRCFERSFYNATVIDAVRFVRTLIAKKVKGFDQSLTGPEDWDFDKKIRLIAKVGVATSPLFHDETNFNLKKYLIKKSYYSSSFKNYINKWGNQDPDIKKQFSFFYRYFTVFVENNKWQSFIKKPNLVLGLFLLRFLVGLMYLQSLVFKKNKYLL